MLKKTFRWILFGFAFSAFFNSLIQAGYPKNKFDAIELLSFPSHSRLMIRIDSRVVAKWKESSNGFELLLEGISLAEFGAPFGNEQAWAKQFETVNDQRLASLRVEESKEGVKILGVWKFPHGDDAPAYPQMIHFDFREATPPQYVVDFWQKKGKSVAEIRAYLKKKRREEALLKAQQEAKKRTERRLASVQKKQEATDLTKYCHEPLNDERDVFVLFKPFHDPVNFARWLPMTTADTEYPYLESSGHSEEDQYLRLALDLYRQGNAALAIRTVDFFEKDYPRSRYKNEMRFLKANALLKLGQSDDGEALLFKLMVDAKSSPEALHSGMYLAAKSITGKKYFQALEHFMWLDRNYPKHRSKWVFHLGLAESLYGVNDAGKAVKEYQWVEENAPTAEARAEGGLRLGDSYLGRGQYPQALAAYFKALGYFKDQAKRFPSVSLNRAEALYQLREYDRAEKAFQEFLTDNSSHPMAWRATYRLGEIYGRKRGEDSQKASSEWLYKTINQYPYSPGSTLARLRLVPCGDHAGFDGPGAEKFFQETAAQFDAGEEILMMNYEDYLVLAQVRAYLLLGYQEKTLEAATDYLRKMGSSKTKKIVSDLFSLTFRKVILDSLEQNEKYKALVLYQKYSWAIPKDLDPILSDYILRLSEAASDLNLGQYASLLLQNYKTFQDTPPETNRNLATQDAPKDIDEKLSTSEIGFMEARALWLASGVQEADKIKEKLDQVSEESEHSFEKGIILGRLAEEKKDYSSALQYALKAQLLITNKMSPKVNLRTKHWLAQLYLKQGSLSTSIEFYQTLRKELAKREPASVKEEEFLDAYGIPAVHDPEALVVAQAELLEKSNRLKDVLSLYATVVEEGMESNYILFQYSRALRKTENKKDHQKAFALLERITASKTDDFWKKLALDTLSNEGQIPRDGRIN